MASNQQNRQTPKPKIPGGVKPTNPPVNPETLEEQHIPDEAPLEIVESVAEHSTALNLSAEGVSALNAVNNPQAVVSSTVANKDEVIKTLTADLADAKARLVDIRSIVFNPFHIVGYLVNRGPIVKVLDRPRGATTEA